MIISRRSFIAAGAAAIAGFGLLGAGWIAPAFAQSKDLSDLDEAPALGEKFLGKADAPVTVIEYASATCPHCANFHVGTFKQLKTDYIDTGKVKFVFREFPFDDLALAAFMLARCADESKYFPMIDVLFEQQKVWTRNNPKGELFKIAKLAGFTEDSFNACLRNEEIAKGILAIRDKGSKSYGVDSTPTFFINGKEMEGNQDIGAFKKMIDEAAGS